MGRIKHWSANAKGTRKKLGQMNKTETRYSEVLEARKLSGEIQMWLYESVRLKLADGLWYLPDFLVMASDDVIEMHEVKGYEEAKARAKRLMAAAIFPFRFYKVTEPRGWRHGFLVEEFGPEEVKT